MCPGQVLTDKTCKVNRKVDIRKTKKHTAQHTDTSDLWISKEAQPSLDASPWFSSDLLSGMKSTVTVCPGHYVVHGAFCIADSIDLEENKTLKIQISGEVDAAEKVCLEELIPWVTGTVELYATADLSEKVEGNCEIVDELVAASTQKG
ncbi:SHC SH2 domain-binding protein 1 [Fukomys damarensis]|uniref:SHC SH2 domain-binding protein 1 n=1 Tax=Fukomys damarensis TaxID=885580 RepID=A0A091D214_FUKDA|nr:SHC SH2 domain-binding protein 1 [Fukomys damarensis]